MGWLKWPDLVPNYARLKLQDRRSLLASLFDLGEKTITGTPNFVQHRLSLWKASSPLSFANQTVDEREIILLPIPKIGPELGPNVSSTFTCDDISQSPSQSEMVRCI